MGDEGGSGVWDKVPAFCYAKEVSHTPSGRNSLGSVGETSIIMYR